MSTQEDPTTCVDKSVAECVVGLGRVFATFGERTQDSGHVSYGVQTPDGERVFVKSAGRDAPSPAGTSFGERVALLRRAAELQQQVKHPALVPLLRVAEAVDGIAVFYTWFDGELLHSPRERRDDPGEPFGRFMRLPAAEIAHALDAIIDVHVRIEEAGWVSGDLYDGCLMYNFADRDVRVIDFEHYRPGPYVNDVGQLPGSTRFMAPEEFEKGAGIDRRTTVFNLGRMIELLLLSHHDVPAVAELAAAATAKSPADRPPTVGELQRQWRDAESRVG